MIRFLFDCLFICLLATVPVAGQQLQGMASPSHKIVPGHLANGAKYIVCLNRRRRPWLMVPGRTGSNAVSLSPARTVPHEGGDPGSKGKILEGQ